MKKKGFKQRVTSIFSLSKSQQRGVLWLLPLLAIVIVILVAANSTKVGDRAVKQSEKRDVKVEGAEEVAGEGDALWRGEGGEPKENREEGAKKRELELFEFDPNTATIQQLYRLGFSAKTAAGIIKYREKGKRFEIPEDFATCYGVTMEHYTTLEPYIRISSKFRAKPSKYAKKWTTQSGTTIELDEEGVQEEEEEVRQLVDINRADSATLRTVSGIGEIMVKRVMEYREALGGFVRKEQLAEVVGMYEANYERICEQIWVDSCGIQKIDVNFASHKSLVEKLGKHPYGRDKMLRKVLKQRQLKGGWSRLEDMVEQNIMTKKEAEKLAPYLVFNTKQ